MYCNECLVFRILLRAGFCSSDCGDGVQHCRQGPFISIGKTFWLYEFPAWDLFFPSKYLFVFILFSIQFFSMQFLFTYGMYEVC
jgi:hypothetical protein